MVATLREEAAAGNLRDALIFLCTGNSTVESAIVKGNSSSEKLFELTLEVRQLEMEQGAKVVVSHVAGERMKGQGTDGVSRGQMKEGVSAGKEMLSYIPFHLSSIQRSPAVEPWLRSWLGPNTEVLEPDGWFERGHDILGGKIDAKGFWRHSIKPGIFVWEPPPAAAAVALEELRKARIKRQESLHVFVCLRLLKPEWFRQLYKAADIVFDVPVGSSCWPVEMYEPLIIGIIFPFLSKPPWQLRGTPKMFYLGRRMREVWTATQMDPGNILHEFLLEFERLRSMPADVVRRLLYFEPNRPLPNQDQSRRRGRKRNRPPDARTPDVGVGNQAQVPKRFFTAQDGDHLLVPFECDLCIFRKMQSRNPMVTNPQDTLLLACIRRANLDAFWSRAKSTALANRDKVAFGLKLSATMGLLGPYELDGPLPDYDHCGYEIAYEMLLHSRRPGSYSESYTQFETIQKLRPAFSNHGRASAKANRISMALGDQKGRYMRFATDPCSSVWFYRFIEGARTRMGQDWRPNKAVPVELLLLVLEAADLKISQREKNR